MQKVRFEDRFAYASYLGKLAEMEECRGRGRGQTLRRGGKAEEVVGRLVYYCRAPVGKGNAAKALVKQTQTMPRPSRHTAASSCYSWTSSVHFATIFSGH